MTMETTPGAAAGPGLTRRAFVAAAGAGLAAGLAGCSSGDDADDTSADDADADDTSADDTATDTSETNSITVFYFDTVIQIDAQCSEELLAQVDERLNYFENTFSRTIEGSDIWNINEAGGQPVEVAEETAELITQALVYCEESGGLFDITIGAVSSLWDFDEGIKPDDADIAEAIQHIDYRTVSVEGTTVTLADPDAMLDLGGVAKGYITDDIVALLAENGCENACLSLGGNVYVMGLSFDGDEWNVGVQDPNGYYDDAVATRSAEDLSVVTSGLYERCFAEDGVTYYHILDPKTGYPVETDLQSASIVCDESTVADAYSTILFLKGLDAAKELVESDDRFLDGIFIDDANDITSIDGSEFEILA